MKTIKQLVCVCLSVFTLFALGLIKNESWALDREELNKTEMKGTATIDLSNIKMGDRIKVYETEDYEVLLDVISSVPEKGSRDKGNSGWSGGNIPGGTHTLYPHIVSKSASYHEIGFYETVVAQNNISIVDTYGETIKNTVIISVSDVESNVINKVASSSRSAKASMTFTSIYTVTGANTKLCYLTSEINTSGQHKISWNF